MKLSLIAKKYSKQLKSIKVVAFDLDGILTDSQVYYQDKEVGFNRFFCVYDGFGMKLLMKSGLKVGVITGGDSVGVRKRVEQLKLNFCYAGNEDKREAFLDLMKKYKVKPHEILYMGDELFDIPLLKKAGFSATVPLACEEVKDCVDYVTLKAGGYGAAREVMELVRYAQKIKSPVEDFND